MDRRQYLGVVGSLFGAGCASNEGTPDPQPPERTPDPESSPDGTPAPQSPDETPDPEAPPDERQSSTTVPQWEYDLSEGSQSVAVTVADGIAVAETGALTRISPTGTVKWETEFDWGSTSVTEPKDVAVAEDTVYYVARSSVGTNKLGAHDEATGGQQWTRTLDISLDSIIKVTEDAVFAGKTAGHEPGDGPILALDVETGEERWRTVTGMASDATSSHGLFIVYSDVTNSLTAFDTATGEVQWEQSSGLNPKLFVVGDTLCVAVGFSVRGCSLPDGGAVWEQSLARDWWFAERAPPDSTHASDICVADGGGELRALNVATGDERWVVTEDWGEFSAMAVGSDSVVIYYSEGMLVSYDLEDGTHRWAHSVATHREEQYLLLVDRTVVLIAQQGGEKTVVQTVEHATGQRRWRTHLSTGKTPPGSREPLAEYIVLVTGDRIHGLHIDSPPRDERCAGRG